MRFLYVVRHADALSTPPGGTDFDRTLSPRGHEQCEELRTWFETGQREASPGLVLALVSTAARTRKTFDLAFGQTPRVESVSYSDLLYNGHREVTAEDVLIDLGALDPVTSSLMVVAHNPSVTELVLTLGGESAQQWRRDGMATASVVVLALDDDRPIGLSSYEVVDWFVPA
jgi:phosphohistidine phosphatase